MENKSISDTRAFPRFMNTVDYAYGLCVQDFQLQPIQQDRMQFGLVFYNCADGPVKFLMEKCELKFDGCITEASDPHKSSIVARGLRMQYLTPVAKRLTTAQVPRISGKIIIEYVYGHPDFSFERRCFCTFTMSIVATPQGIALSSVTDEHREESLLGKAN